jgi:hypothetical protein
MIFQYARDPIVLLDGRGINVIFENICTMMWGTTEIYVGV